MTEHVISLSEFADPARWPGLLEYLVSPSCAVRIVGDASCHTLAVTDSASSLVDCIGGEYSCKQLLAVGDGKPWSSRWLGDAVTDGQLLRAADCLCPDSLLAAARRDSDVVIGIGDNTAMNAAKALASSSRSRPALLLVPSSLATDSFLTNKYRLPSDNAFAPSRTGRYPDRVVIALPLIRSAPERVNSSGLGESVAMYSAVLDLSVCEPERDLASAIASLESILVSVNDHMALGPVRTHQTFGLLALKALVMWEHSDCRWGAGSEHKIAYALDEITGSRVLHGEGCAFGAWLVCRFLAMRRIAEVELSSLRSILVRAQLPVSPEEFDLSQGDVHRVLQRARSYRTERPALIDSLGPSDFGDMCKVGCIK